MSVESELRSELSLVKEENTRLQNELDSAVNEKIQAAQHGLALLEEIGQLKNSLAETENNADILKQELDLARKVCIIIFNVARYSNFSPILHILYLVSFNILMII